MPWKNGLCSTSQIGIYPESAQFPDESFLWRVSTAKVQDGGPFSQFLGYERILTVVQGAGLLLNGQELRPLVPLRFAGEERIEARLINGPIDDLGIIFDPKRIVADMQVHLLGPMAAG